MSGRPGTFSHVSGRPGTFSHVSGGPGTFSHVSDVTDRANYADVGDM